MTPLEHFLGMARQGKRPGCNSEEKRARSLALCILDNVPGLDDDAIDGMIELINSVRMKSEIARDAVDTWESH